MLETERLAHDAAPGIGLPRQLFTVENLKTVSISVYFGLYCADLWRWRGNCVKIAMLPLHWNITWFSLVHQWWKIGLEFQLSQRAAIALGFIEYSRF